MESRLGHFISFIASWFVFRSVESRPTAQTVAAAEANCVRGAVGDRVGRQTSGDGEAIFAQILNRTLEGVGL